MPIEEEKDKEKEVQSQPKEEPAKEPYKGSPIATQTTQPTIEVHEVQEESPTQDKPREEESKLLEPQQDTQEMAQDQEISHKPLETLETLAMLVIDKLEEVVQD